MKMPSLQCAYMYVDVSFSPLETISISTFLSHLYRLSPSPHLRGSDFTIIFQYYLSPVMSAVSSHFSYLPGCCLPLSVYAAPFFFSPVLPCSSFFVIFSSLLLVCPYQLNHFCLRNVDIWHTFASSCIVWFFDNDMVSFLLHFGLFCYV